MDKEAFLTMAHIAGEVWGTQARAYATPSPSAGSRVLGYDVYFEIFGKLREAYKEEVTIETETPNGEDD